VFKIKAYLDIVRKILEQGELKENRTSTDTISIPGVIFEHDMSEGFPLLTTKSVPLRLVASELEFFIKGLTDKDWLRVKNNNHIWDEWCSPDKVPYSHDPETQKKMMEERELGPIYGWQWRNFGAKYQAYNKPPKGEGIDQLKKVIKTIKENPNSRRMLVSAWNPVDMPHMALPPCHYCFQVIVIGNKLNLLWNQRSVDTALGLPFNIASYALLLHLLAKETGLEEGKLVGFLGDTHIYKNHIPGLKEQLKREPFPLPKIKTENFTSIFDWKYTDTKVINYKHHPRIKFKIAV
jgi:thymidylate synthase